MLKIYGIKSTFLYDQYITQYPIVLIHRYEACVPFDIIESAVFDVRLKSIREIGHGVEGQCSLEEIRSRVDGLDEGRCCKARLQPQ